MEADDFSRCGGTFYARGHLRAIARAVGTDPEPLLAGFDDSHPPAEAERSSRMAEHWELPRPTLQATRPRWTLVLGAVLVGLLGWGMIRLFTLPGDGQASAAQSSPTVAASTQPVRPAPARPPVVRPPTVAPKPVTPRLELTLSAGGAGSYVTLRDLRGRRLFQGLLGPNSAHTITYPGSIRVTLGAVRNVGVVANGTRLRPAAGRFTVTVAGALAPRR
jgi:hypothetical protein